MMSGEDVSIENLELGIRKITRGQVPNTGDVLFRGERGWILSNLNIQGIAWGEFEYPQVTVSGNRTVRQDILGLSREQGILPGDFILIGVPGGANPDVSALAVAVTDGFRLYFSNLVSGSQNSLTDPLDNTGRFIAFRLRA